MQYVNSMRDNGSILRFAVFASIALLLNQESSRALASALVTAQAHSLSIVEGNVCAVGENQYGQLGDGTAVNRFIPVWSAGVSKAVAVSTNAKHSLVASSDGVWAWGSNSSGQLGDGTAIDKLTPVRVLNLNAVMNVAAGLNHSLALKSDGTVWAWGSNNYGQLGDGTTVAKNMPVPVISLTGVVAIAAGANHSVALKGDGTVWTWGYNKEGELGDGTTEGKTSATQVTGLAGMSAIAAGGAHTLAIRKSDGSVWTWGYGNYGQLGNGTSVSQSSLVRVSALTGIVAIAGGEQHSTAVKSDGTVWAWGSNQNGQLGNRTTTSTNIPVQVLSMSNAAAVAAGADFTTVLKNDGTRWSWGNNTSGQLGTGTTVGSTGPVLTAGCSKAPAITLPPLTSGMLLSATAAHTLWIHTGGTVCSVGENQYAQLGDGTFVGRLTPVAAAIIAGTVAVKTGPRHSLAVGSDGAVWSWGNNDYGQLGDGTTVFKPTPVRVPGLQSAIGVATGRYHSAALKADGTVWTWGYNNYGQLGDGTNIGKNTPVQVIGLSGAVAITSGDYHIAVLKSDGTVWTWGYNGDGELGDGTRVSRNSPVAVPGLTDAIALASGSAHSLVIRKADGSVWTWGYGAYGQLGAGGTDSQVSIVRASGLDGVVAIAGGTSHSLAVKLDGTVWTWGLNNYGQLGNRTTTNSAVPQQVSDLAGASQVAGGADYSIAVKADGSRLAWGNNTSGQLGTGTTTGTTVPIPSLDCPSLAPTPVSAATATLVTAAAGHSAAVKGDGTLWAWGLNDYGQLGNGTKVNTSAASRVIGPAAVAAADLGARHGLAVTTAGAVWAWGSNSDGQLGDGTTVDKATPFQVPAASAILAVASGLAHSVALKRDGTLIAWGANNYGQLGDGTTTRRTTPMAVIGMTNVIAIATGDYHSVALKNDGTVWTWGYNGNGELGDGTRLTRTFPVQVNNLSDTVAIAAGSNHNLAIRKTDGSVWTWGYGASGQLGDGDTNSEPTIVRASGLTGMVAAAGGQNHSLAIRNDGSVWAWGLNQSGQLGNGSSTNSIVPVQTLGLTNASGVAAGSDHSVALTADGRIFSWGSNSSGQLGVTSPSNTTVPVLTGTGFVASVAANTLVVSPSNYPVSYQSGAAPPGALAPITVTTTVAPVAFTAASDSTWLKITPLSGTTPSTITATVNPAGLSAGTYTATISITAASLGNNPQVVTVRLTVTGPVISPISVIPSSLAFSAQQNTPVSPQTAVVTSQNAAVGFQVQVATASGGSWLSATPASGITPANLSITASPGNLPPGQYSGSLILSYGDGKVTVSVSLTVNSAPFDVDSSALQFTVRQGSTSARSLLVTNRSTQPLSVSVSSKANKPWVAVSSYNHPINAGESAYYSINVVPNQIHEGQGSDSIVVSAAGQQREVSLSVVVANDGSLQPQLSATAVTLATLQGQNNFDSTKVILLNAGSDPMYFGVTREDNAIDVNPTGPVCKSTPCDSFVLGTQATQVLTFSTADAVKTKTASAGPYTVFSVPVTVGYSSGPADVVNVYVNVVTGPKLPPKVSAAGVLVGLAGQDIYQTVSMLNRSSGLTAFKVAAPAWLQVTPLSGNLPDGGALDLTIGPVLRQPTANDSSVITLSFPDFFGKSQPYVLGIQALYAGGAPGLNTSSARRLDAAVACTAANLTGVFTSPANTFEVPATLPVELVVRLADNCGDVPGSGSAMVSFSNGDPPVSLTVWPDGLWRGTWQPGSAQSGAVTLRLFAGSTAISGAAVSTVAGSVTGASGVPVILSRAVINAASQQGGSDTISPGEIISIYGSNLAAGATAAGGAPRTPLGSVTATLGGVALPLFYVSPGQVNAVAPFILPIGQTVQLIVFRDGLPSVPLRLTVVQARPGIFTQSNDGSGPGSIVDNTGAGYVVDTQHPAHRGDIVSIYCAGLGSVDRPVDINAPAPGSEPLPRVSGVSVIVGNNSAEVLYAGLAPGFYGLYQVNVRVPANAVLGDAVPVALSVNNIPSNGVTIAIR